LDSENDGSQQVLERMAEIETAADENGARLLLVMVPAPVQVCNPSQLTNFSRNLDLSDSSRYDLDMPQALMERITSMLNIRMLDLRSALLSTNGQCYYQSKNMHWTETGHQVVADYLSNALADEVGSKEP
jgi:hypothetical protein